MEKIKHLNIEMMAKPPIKCDLSIGKEVIFTNEYGVSFYGLKVIGYSEEVEHGRFLHLNTDCYWFPVSRSSLQSMSFEKQMNLLNTLKSYCDMPRLLKLTEGLVAQVNGYKIVYNSYLKHFTLSHDDIGVIDHHWDFDSLCEDAQKG